MKEPRVYLRALEIADYETTLCWHNDDAVWSSVAGPKFYVSPEYEKRWVEGAIFSEDAVKLAVCLKEDDRHIGLASLTEIDWINRSAAAGVMIGDKAFWGQGYATEALVQLLRFGFEERGLHRMSASMLESNTASRKIAMKLGFREEGLLRDAVFKNGRFQNLVILSLLEEEFAEIEY